MTKSVNVASSASLLQSFHGHQIQNSHYLEPTSEKEILDIIGSLTSHKSLGIDETPTKLIKVVKHSLAPYLSKIFNNCLINGQCPDVLKIAKVILLHRSGLKLEPKKLSSHICAASI